MAWSIAGCMGHGREGFRRIIRVVDIYYSGSMV